MKINKNLFIALCAMLFVAILIIAFLLGRESASHKQSSAANPGAASSPQSKLAENIPATPSQYPGISNSGNQAAGTPNLPETAKTGQPEQTQTADASEKEKIKNYFQQIDTIGTLETISGNSQELAGQIVQNALNENYSEIDEMIQKCQSIKTLLEAITAPQPCAEFHAQLIESVNDASIMYSDFKNFFKRKDQSVLKSLSERATTLNLKMATLDGMQKSIKLKYGIY